MRAVLLLIAREYMTVGQIRRNAEKFYGLSFEESLIAAYENMKTEAAAAVRGVSEIRPNPAGQPTSETRSAAPALLGADGQPEITYEIP